VSDGQAPRNRRLAAVTAAALALPGITPRSQAQTPVERPETDLRYSRYDESGRRMQIDILHASGLLPLSDHAELGIDFLDDIITGASPIYKQPDASGRPVQVMTGPSLSEHRRQGAVHASYYLENNAIIGVGGGVSDERDYLARFLSVDARFDLNQKSTTFALGYSVSLDEIEPTTTGIEHDRQTHMVNVGVTQILSKNSLFQSTLSYTDDDGFLSHSYKMVFVQNVGLIPDHRPNHRGRWAWLNRYVQYIPNLDAALHLDYRFYTDSWNIDAHTVEVSWHQPLPHGWQAIPRFRYYSQDQAEFYRDFFFDVPLNGNVSSDYRLAGFGAISGGLTLTKEMSDNLSFDADFEYYDRQADYQLGDNEGSAVDDLQFSTIMLGMKLGF
jgi:hypothetical protein